MVGFRDVPAQNPLERMDMLEDELMFALQVAEFALIRFEEKVVTEGYEDNVELEMVVKLTSSP